jgi:hypothetical protein
VVDGSDEFARDQVAPPGEQPAPVLQWASGGVFLAEEAGDAIERELSILSKHLDELPWRK